MALSRQPSGLSRSALAADALYALLRSTFNKVPDTRQDVVISMGDALMSAFAMFALKDPSLLAFDQRRRDLSDNFRTVFGIQHVPCDTQMRTILDPVDPAVLRPCFRDIFRRLQRGKVLESFTFLDGRYLISLDGTKYFSTTSDDIHCDECLTQKDSGGNLTHRHKFLGAVLVHPDHKEVIPLAPESIVNGDGKQKNDCERNATRRWLRAFRHEHPSLPVIVVEDDLAANAPHLRDLKSAGAKYIISVKPGDHKFLFKAVAAGESAGRGSTLTTFDAETGVLRRYRYQHGLPLNESSSDTLVNVLEYWELKRKAKKGKKKILQSFGWITDLPLTEETVYDVMRGGRCRWKIENETFNTLKNQGYKLEHNYGHGEKHLSRLLATMMMLAFLVDQCQQIGCPVFRAACRRCGCKRELWEMLRSTFGLFRVQSMVELLGLMACRERCPAVTAQDTS
jgi:hypothetical protein